MRRSLLAFLIVCLFGEAAASARPVFFDDFDGNTLLPHWNQPIPTDWTYNVSGGMLNVTALNYPSSPKSPGNSAGMNALFAS